MIFVDTNVLIHACNALSPQHGPSLRFLEDLRVSERPWFLSWPVVFEFLRVVTHPAVFAKPLDRDPAVSFVDACLSSPSSQVLVASLRHRNVLGEVMDDAGPVAGNLWHDVHTVTLMREHGVAEIATYDRDFRRFRQVRIVEPGN